MKILIFGAGALGSLLGSFFASHNEVTLVARKAHAEAIQKDGLRIQGIRTTKVKVDARTEVEGGEDPDLLLLTTKAYDTVRAITALRPAVAPTTVLLTAQNGVGNYEALKQAFPDHTVLGASVTYGAMLVSPGVVQFAGAGEVLLGGTPHEHHLGASVARTFRAAGLNALGVPDIQGHLWQKAIVNAAVNPISALRGLRNGELLDDPEIVERMKAVVREAAAVARANKIQLPERDPYRVVEKVLKATTQNRSSMLMDLEKGRRTEIEAINGVFVEFGRKFGLPTPETQALLDAVRAREAKAR